MDLEAYLKRIDYSGPRDVTAETLRQLHCAHLLTVPFENLDIPLRRPISLELPAIFDKIVQLRRGGFCYELNGLFAWLIKQLGFPVMMLSARVFENGRPGPEFDHLVLAVELDERFVADVGFGDSFLEPLRIDVPEESMLHGTTYRIAASDSERVLERRRESGWEPQYVFSLTPHRFREFSAMCHHQQTSPESSFTRKSLCSLATPRGRITLSNNRLITTTDGRRIEREVRSEDEYRVLLETRFGIVLEEEAPVRRLLYPGAPG